MLLDVCKVSALGLLFGLAACVQDEPLVQSEFAEAWLPGGGPDRFLPDLNTRLDSLAMLGKANPAPWEFKKMGNFDTQHDGLNNDTINSQGSPNLGQGSPAALYAKAFDIDPKVMMDAVSRTWALDYWRDYYKKQTERLQAKKSKESPNEIECDDDSACNSKYDEVCKKPRNEKNEVLKGEDGKEVKGKCVVRDHSCMTYTDCLSRLSESCVRRVGEDEKTVRGICIPSWFGHCHAKTSVTMLEVEPKSDIRFNETTIPIAELQALLMIFHHDKKYRFIHKKCTEKNLTFDQFDRPTLPECRDTNPGTYHIIASNYLSHGQSFGFDNGYDYQIHNYAASKFEVKEKREVSAAEAQHLVAQKIPNSSSQPSTTVETPSDGTDGTDDSPYVWTPAGTVAKFFYIKSQLTKNGSGAEPEYEYVLELDAEGRIIGGEWVGSTKKAHPDYLFLPGPRTQDVLAEGLLEYEKVAMLASESNQPLCGNGIVALINEECDGNGKGGGGETRLCDADCTHAYCGDKYVNTAAGEECDDGNMNDNDACKNGCVWSNGPPPALTVITPPTGPATQGPAIAATPSGPGNTATDDVPAEEHAVDGGCSSSGGSSLAGLLLLLLALGCARPLTRP